MKIQVLICVLFFPLIAWSQEEKEMEAVKIAIQKLFDGMRIGDSTQVRKVFVPGARMQTSFVDKEGQPKLVDGDLEKFIAAVGTPHEEIWDERIWSYDIRIDGTLAAAWTPYSFYVGEKFSHCGVNAFHLFKSREGWRITHITDTRRKINCPEK